MVGRRNYKDMEPRTEPLLEEIAARIRSCTRCGLAGVRTNAVPGEGAQHALIMLVGEAPGEKEDETGRPFVGRSGKLLTDLLQREGVRREDLFITSIIKCRPPENREPSREEVRTCAPHLLMQLDSISPKVLVTMGNSAYDMFSTTFYLPTKKVGEVRGKVFRLHSTACSFLIPTYHPAGLIYNRKLIPDFQNDIRTAIRYSKMTP